MSLYLRCVDKIHLMSAVSLNGGEPGDGVPDGELPCSYYVAGEPDDIDVAAALGDNDGDDGQWPRMRGKCADRNSVDWGGCAAMVLCDALAGDADNDAAAQT